MNYFVTNKKTKDTLKINKKNTMIYLKILKKII